MYIKLSIFYPVFITYWDIGIKTVSENFPKSLPPLSPLSRNTYRAAIVYLQIITSIRGIYKGRKLLRKVKFA